MHSASDCVLFTDPVLPIGETRHPFTIYAWYGSCVPALPCPVLPGPLFQESFPPLPPGDYRVKLLRWDPVLPDLPPMTVHVTAR